MKACRFSSSTSPAATGSAAAQKAAYVACNVYVSAGGQQGHGPLLLQLLRHAQGACRQQQQHRRPSVGVVHAYADPVYNRSSFHLVGREEPLAAVAASLACQAVQSLRTYQHQTTAIATADEHDDTVHHHPHVGFVDHIAIMPVEGRDCVIPNHDAQDSFLPSTPSGRAARHVGTALQQQEGGIGVHYYGTAHPQGTSLATVRREKTPFFKSGGLAGNEHNETVGHTQVATVGAPLEFVENYNIRLTSACPKKTAQSLTKHVRERDGGLTGVEALTLPYSQGRWEVACNLLCPEVASTADIDDVIQSWQQEEDSSQNFLETAYRVGTTAKQCLECMRSFDDTMWEQHDAQVKERLKSYLSY